ncbi:hypothetical protein SARC_07340 [Sphaeroforma arctica JP610]|uniref:RRM domain-containing protein n=1 Tax=Sphaeroforma arctica JP610 TaxID=667725 RepID=A0A0L0FTZ2_9EUKA|nr:hypothetical protein SARC_07340 [Sphaeroforma arctica JP610]KNC80292.1 hypothetical protein SARC_07340 [Sphaeroforma arctica JP610]|eukprot:XP_014154194.1 hypothetical protein SARC_07340 [Sphaeroforma arctica JP610]
MNVSQKKTPYELEKDKRERRKKEEEAAAAKVFEEFVENFQQEENDGYTSKTFVRGSTINPSAVYNPNEGASSQDQAPSFYTLKSAKPVAQEPKPPTRPTTGKKSKEPKKLSNLEMFKEQLKKEQEERELRKAMRAGDPNAPKLGPSGPPLDSIYGRPEEKPGSRADGDMSTTNIYVGNLAATANEEMLCRIFGKYGPLASVKIMWPMTPEERARGRNPAFVAFMNREDAMDAMHALNNSCLHLAFE